MSSIEFLGVITAPLILLVLYISIFRTPRLFFLVLFASKPLIDQTVRIKIIKISGADLNLLAITGVMTFVAVILLNFFKKKSPERIAARGVIILFIIMQFFVGVYSIINDRKFLINGFEIFIRLSTPYFLYFIFHRFLVDKVFKYKLVKIIWLSNLVASLISIFVYFRGFGYIDISQDVSRFSGFYGDSATLSLAAFTAFSFAILFREMYPNKMTKLNHFFFWLTMASYIFLTWITLTKATLLISGVFVILWFGFYKRKIKLAFLLLLIALPLLFSTEAFQKRFRKEIAIFKSYGEIDLSISDLRGLGSGRFGRWVDGLSIYINEYNESEKLFGTNLFYKVHNQYIATLLQVGLVGLVIFLFIIWILYRALLRSYFFYRTPFNFMGIIFLTSILLYGLGYISFSYTTMMWITMILISNVNMKTERIMSRNHGCARYHHRRSEIYENNRREHRVQREFPTQLTRPTYYSNARLFSKQDNKI